MENPQQQQPGKIGIWIVDALLGFVGREGRMRRKRRRIAKRFRELDDDGEGIGTAEMAQLMAVAFQHTLGQEAELRVAYRVFELLNKADVGDLVTLPELLEVMPQLEEEIREQQRKNKRSSAVDANSSGTWAITNALSRLVMPPESSFWTVWDFVKLVVVLYYMLEVPVRFCFLAREELDGSEGDFFTSANIFSDVFMACNVVLTFFRGYIHPTRGVITVFQEIRMHYVFGVFPLDLFACCPLDLWLPAFNPGGGLFARPKAMARLVRLVHLRHISGSKNNSSHSTVEASDGFFRAALMMIGIILTMVHFLACCWWMLGTRWDGFDGHVIYNATHPYDKFALTTSRGSWTYTYEHRPGEPPIGGGDGETPFWWQYLISFYWSSGRITGQSSPGNIFAASWFELGWICAMFLLNVAVNGYCDGILVDKVIAGDEAAIESKAMRKIVDEYVQNADLPLTLVAEVRASAEESGKLVERQRMDETIAALPHSLKQRVARRLFFGQFVQSEIFAQCSESFVVELGAACKIIFFSKESLLAHIGEPAMQLMILNSGRLCVTNAAGVRLAETSTVGEMVGEMPFIFDLKHVVSISTLEESRLTILSRKDFQTACRLYPDDAMALRRASSKAIASLDAENDEDDKRSSKSKALGKAKSIISYAKSARSSSSASSANSARTSVSTTLRRMYATDLRLVVDKMREEQAAARQDLICNFIQHAADGDLDKVEAVLAKGEVLVDEADYDQRTALHLAVCAGHEQVVKCLVEQHGANIHVKDRFGHTPMDDAVREQQGAIVLYLKSRGGMYQVDNNVAADLCQAASENNLEKLQLVLTEVGVSPNCADYDKRTPLHLAASEGHTEVVQLLINLPGVELSPKDRLGNTPLDDAMRHRHMHVRKLLQHAGARLGDANVGVMLCDHGFSNNVDTIRDMADSQINMDTADYDNRTCLHLAASEGHLSTCTYLLLEARANPNPLDRFLNTPLDDAIRHDRQAVAAFLRDFGGLVGKDPNMREDVERFKKRREREQAEMSKEKLDKEVNNSEVLSIIEHLRRLRQHPTLEDDAYGFATHANNFRSLLLQLLHASVLPLEANVDQEENAKPNRERDEDNPLVLTNRSRERLLEISSSGLEQCAAKIISTLEAELMPWLNSMSKNEARALSLFMPGFKEGANRIFAQMSVRTQLTRLVRKLWSDKAAHGYGGYECVPLGLLMQRNADAPMDIVSRARLEAMALCWTNAPATQLYAKSVALRAQESAKDDDENRSHVSRRTNLTNTTNATNATRDSQASAATSRGSGPSAHIVGSPAGDMSAGLGGGISDVRAMRARGRSGTAPIASLATKMMAHGEGQIVEQRNFVPQLANSDWIL